MRRPKILDLGHPLTAADPVFPGDPRTFAHTVLPRDSTQIALGMFSSPEHYGTHLDAPFHFCESGWTVDQIPPDRLLRPGARILTVGDVLQLATVHRHERDHGPIPTGAIVLIATGWDRYWNDEPAYTAHYPGIELAAAQFLVEERGVVALGIDTLNVDPSTSTAYEVHRYTLSRNLYHLENAAGLTELPACGFDVLVAPLKLAGATGAPARIFALFPV